MVSQSFFPYALVLRSYFLPQRGGCCAEVPEATVRGQTHRSSRLLLGRGCHTLPCPAISRGQGWSVSLWYVVVMLIQLQYYKSAVLIY